MTPRSVARILGLVAVVAFLGLLAYGLTTKAANTSLDDALSRGRARAAPGFELTKLTDGRPGPLGREWRAAAADGRVALGEFRGTPIVLNVWASWCDPCRAEAARLERAWVANRANGVLFLGLNQQDAREDAMDFLRQFEVSFPQVRDPGKETALAWGATGLPETYFISPDGRVVGHVVGVVSEEQLDAGVAAARSGRPVGVRTGGERRPAR